MFLASGWKTCLQSAWTCLQMITEFTHTNLVQSLGNYKCGPSWRRFEKQIRAVCWLNKKLMRKKKSRAERSDGEILRNAQPLIEMLHCSYILQQFSMEQKCISQEISRTGPSSTHISNASEKKRKRKTLGSKKWRKKKVWFLSHSIRQRSQICLEWSQASRTEWFRERCAENGAPWQQQKSLQLYLQSLYPYNSGGKNANKCLERG